ncbi:MAG: 2-oxo acid dehydrogenase subunit E2 [Planctomycetaceae bacterium]|nr:2-oxo acid dehydrogenase subunit E2 [Planctomycetaceae bacterium]MBV8312488.1 2-oxo acid dehydrogenase subunit E2 [Planctomycetaceae bacterium]
MPTEVTMPKLSPTMESGVIAQWLVKVGDTIKEGDVLADIETDKATMQMKSYDDGIIVHIDHPAGDEVALGQRVMVLAKKGEDPKQVAAGLGLGGGQAAAPSKAGGDEVKPAVAASGSTGATTSGNGQQEQEVAEPPFEAHGDRLKASPLARKMAESSQLDLNRIRGTGPGGRIIRRDIEAYLSGSPVQAPAPVPAATAAETATPPASTPAQAPVIRPATPPAPAAPTAPVARPTAAAVPLAAQRIPHSRMRKTIAQRMLQAKQTAPEIHVTVEIRVDKMVAIREDLNRQLAAENIKLSLGDFVTKAVAIALRRHPGLNASYEPDAIVRHREINIGIAVALDEGLIVPVLHRADTLGLAEIRRQSEALAVAARSKQLTTEQLTGSTFTISNLGMFGIHQFDAILNLPEVGILAVAAAERRPVVEGDKLVPGTVLAVTLTADHRAVDGAMAADFVRTIKRLLEEPAMMLL